MLPLLTILLLQAAPVARANEPLPGWLAVPFGLACLGGAVGLFFCLRGFIRLASSDVVAFPAAQASVALHLPATGTYHIGCARANRFNRGFRVPEATFELRQLATGQRWTLRTSNWFPMRKTDMSGTTTETIASFTITEPGEYELRNPDGHVFAPADRLRVGPANDLHLVGLVLGTVLSGLGLIGGGILGLIAAVGPR